MLQKILDAKIIAILRAVPEEKIIDVATAIYNGGISVLEITVLQDRTDGAEITARCIEKVKNHFDGKMIVGAGTVMTLEQLDTVVNAGAEFILSPNLNEEVVRKTKELGKISIPGALTPSEIADAYSYGADIVKLFPASAMGQSYIKAIRGPMPHIPISAVGGVSPENAKSFLEAGAVSLGLGSDITRKEWIDNNDYESITAQCKKYVDAIL